MTYENKGAVGSTVTVSMDPDRSGNYPCDGVNDHLDIQAALDGIEEGTVEVFGGPTGTTDYSLGATVDIAYKKTLKFVWGHTVIPSADIRMFEVAAGGSIQGLQADVEGLGEGGFTNEIIYLDGTRNGDDTWWKRGMESRFKDITLRYGNTWAWTPSGVAIELEALGSLDSVSWSFWNNIMIKGLFEKGIYLHAENAVEADYPYVNANNFQNVGLYGCEYMIYLDGDWADPNYGMVAGNIFSDLQMQHTASVVSAVYGHNASNNMFKGRLWDWGAGKTAIDMPSGNQNYFVLGCGRDIIGNVEYVFGGANNTLIEYIANKTVPAGLWNAPWA